jgi:flagellar hook-associated protein 1 FlgK
VNTASIYDSAMAGLQYAQAGMVVTSQNVTGSNVAGYVRRNPNLQISTLSPSSIQAGGTAFSVEGFTRNFNALLQGQLLSQQSKTSFTATLTQAVSTLDAMLVDPSASIATALGNFFNAAGSLANDPKNQAYQQALVGAANQVGDRIRGLADLVGNLESNAQQGLADVLNQANSLAPQLADINVRIKNSTVPGLSYPSGDLLDERDRITAKLQELIGGTTAINEDGTASYSVNGIQLVDRVRANRFSQASGSTTITANSGLPGNLYLAIPATPDPGTQLRLSTQNPNDREAINLQISNKLQATPLPSNSFKDGQAGAYAVLLQNFAPTLHKSLNLLAVELMNKVNTVAIGTAGAITPIFGFKNTDANGPSELKNLADTGATPNIQQKLNDPTIAFSELLDPASPQFSAELDSWLQQNADAKNFVSVATWSTTQFANLMSASGTDAASAMINLEGLRSKFSEPVTFITSSVASTIATWTNQHKTNEALSQVLSDQKNAISGVNLDEEAANLVKYQQLYNAASKLIQTNRQMFDTLLAMLAGN